MSGVELGTFNEVRKLGKRPPAYDMATHAATGFCKPSIILFDTRPGTRSFTTPSGVTRIRAFVVGAGGDGGGAVGGSGGGYSEKEYLVSGGDVFSYTVGAAPGGTSSFNAEITATGGVDASAQGNTGAGSGGDVNFSGGVSTGTGGASSAHRSGNGLGASGNGGAGWGEDTGNNSGGSSGGIDGFGLSLTTGGREGGNNNATVGVVSEAKYGSGSGSLAGQYTAPGGVGGGSGGTNGTERGSHAGIGGGGGSLCKGGFGLVGIEVLEVE